MENITLQIDGKEIDTRPGRTVLEAALDGGIYIPHICHHPDLTPVGKCGLCVVEIQGMDEPAKACMTQAAAGMVIRTASDVLDGMRQEAMDALLADHPTECMECGKYLNCELQALRQYLGVSVGGRRDHNFKHSPPNHANPLFVHDFMRCIKCGRCVRACNELRGVGVLHFIAEGESPRLGIPEADSLAAAGCRFCGACVEVCPTGALMDKPELIGEKHRREALVPCRYTCPAQIDVPRYVNLVRQGKYAEATAVIRERVPFPLVLGHVCNHLCEDACRRGQLNEPISIRDLKRFAAENDQERLWVAASRKAPPTGKHVAVVGSGPAGLTAAYYLAKLGHAVTVYEALPLPGGMLRYGIPEYRLSRDVLDSEIKEIERVGVAFRTDCRIQSLEDLKREADCDAILMAIGAHKGVTLPIPGADLEGVIIGLDFLRKVNSGEAVAIGKQLVVLGGGNVAFDCARIARRLGAQHVTIACLESKSDMPAACDEIEEGEEEGIEVLPMLTFTKIVAENGRAAGVSCLDVAQFQFDEDGRLTLETVDGSDRVLAADTVIFAIGQQVEIPGNLDLELDKRRRIDIDPLTLQTSRQGAFAIGDAVLGTSSVIEAVASGRDGAKVVDRYLGGRGDISETLVPPEVCEPCLGDGDGFANLDRCTRACVLAAERVESFCTIVQSMDATDAEDEAGRCLRCDMRMKITPVKFWGEY